MPAYQMKIIQRKCQVCRSRATVEVYNTWNSLVGYFCAKHGGDKMRELNNDTGGQRKYE